MHTPLTFSLYFQKTRTPTLPNQSQTKKSCLRGENQKMGDSEKQDRNAVVVEEEEEEEKKVLMEDMDVLDFDLLCSTVASQTHGKWSKLEPVGSGDFDVESGGVMRMWEGEILDCFDDSRIALESTCCPCYRFGKNMRRASFGYCLLQGTIHFILSVGILLSSIAYIVTKRNCFLYIAVAVTILVATYLGFFRTQIRKKFNIKGSDSSFDDCIYHLICPCCTLCQESRTLEMNNIQDGTWHGRGDTICIGSYREGSKAFVELHPPSLISTKSSEPCNSMQKNTNGSGLL